MSSSIKILLVEESSFMAQIMLRQLSQMDYNVKIASSGAEALEIMRSWIADIILLDLFLNDMKAEELARKFKHQYPSSELMFMSSSSRDQYEDLLNELSVKTFMQKPIAKERLLEIVHYLAKEKEDHKGQSAVILDSPANQGYEVHIKSCYCCGYDQVRVFVTKENSHEEDWTTGLYPVYKPIGNFANWDFLKTRISVCPLCLFASSDLRDFAEKNHHNEFPYKPEARKILSTGISTRKKLIGLRADEKDHFAFDTPNRTKEQVIQSLQLAQKCGNAMILADKKGAHCDLGELYVLEQCLHERPNTELLQTALGFFQGQIKTQLTPRPYLAKSYFFTICCYFALNQSLKANEVKEQLEAFYQRVDPADALEEECLWNQRLVYIWQMGINIKDRREIY